MLQRVVPTMWCKNNGLFKKKKKNLDVNEKK